MNLPLRYLGKTYSEIVQDTSERLESLEHLANQQSILVDTLGDIMEELRKQEHMD